MVVSDPQSDELGLELPARDVLVELTSLASVAQALTARVEACLLYTSPSPRDS